MRIQVNSDKNIAADTQLIRFVRADVNRALERFQDRLTRVEVHLSDVNSGKPGSRDKRCLIEVRPARHQPLAVTMAAARVDSAVRGAVSKLKKALDTFFGRTGRHRAKVRAGKMQPAHSPRRTKNANPDSQLSARSVALPTTRAAEQTATGGSRPKRKAIYQARRTSWPKR